MVNMPSAAMPDQSMSDSATPPVTLPHGPDDYRADDYRGDGGDDAFADELAGNVFPGRKPSAARGHSTHQGLFGSAQTHLYDLAEGGKDDLMRNIASVTHIVRELAEQVEKLGFEPLSNYARQATSMVDTMHDSLAEKSIDDLIDDGRALVRQQPEIAVIAAVIIGYIGARLLKARS